MTIWGWELPNLIQWAGEFFVLNFHITRYCQSLQILEEFVRTYLKSFHHCNYFRVLTVLQCVWYTVLHFSLLVNGCSDISLDTNHTSVSFVFYVIIFFRNWNDSSSFHSAPHELSFSIQKTNSHELILIKSCVVILSCCWKVLQVFRSFIALRMNKYLTQVVSRTTNSL